MPDRLTTPERPLSSWPMVAALLVAVTVLSPPVAVSGLWEKRRAAVRRLLLRGGVLRVTDRGGSWLHTGRRVTLAH